MAADEEEKKLTQEHVHVRLAVGSRFENIDLIHIVFDDALLRWGIDEDARHWVGLALREAVANAIKHGNRQDPRKPVEVELTLERREMVIRIRDRGEGFDPTEVADPLAPENLLKPNGRGIFYMKSFMDLIDYEFLPGQGTVVTMRKSLVIEEG